MLRQTTLLPFYLVTDTWLHRMPLGTKLVTAATYAMLAFTATTLVALLSLCILIVVVTLLSGLPLPHRIFTLTVVLLLVIVVIARPDVGLVLNLIQGLARITILSTVVLLLTITTRFGQTLQPLQRSHSGFSGARVARFLLNMTLMVVPSMQYDLQRAIDAETLRRGKRLKFYSLNSWVTVLTTVLVRSLSRAERLADTVLDRGLVLSEAPVPSDAQPLLVKDIILTLIAILPGVLVVTLLR